MSKIIIWSLGTGGRILEGKTEYRNAKYYRDSKETALETPYIYDALEKFYDFDKCVIIGTAGSGWCSFYEHLFDNSGNIDTDYWEELCQMQKSPVHYSDDTNEVRAKLENLKMTLGEKCAEIIVLKYGINKEEMLFNFNAMARIGDFISDGDSVSFDITHSFRSLAFYEFLAVSYFKDVLRKNVSIDFVSYGMLEFKDENGGFTPIIDLSLLVNMTDWLKSADEYRRYGTTALLLENLEKENLEIHLANEDKKILRLLGGDAVSTNDLPEFKKLIRHCIGRAKEIANKNFALGYIFDDIVVRFGGDKLNDEMQLQAQLAKWHFEKKRYINAAITLIEATLDYCAKLSGKSKDEIRDTVRLLNTSNNDLCGFRDLYNKVRDIRNKLCHATPLLPGELKILEENINNFYTIYMRIKANPENEEALKYELTKEWVIS